MQYNFSNFKAELKRAEEFLGKEYSQLNIGRASPMVLDGVSVESYGSYVPLKNVASVSIEDPKTLRVSPWDKSQIKGVEKAIAGANVHLIKKLKPEEKISQAMTTPPASSKNCFKVILPTRRNL